MIPPLQSFVPRGPGILLAGNQHVPPERVGHLTWGAAYLGGAIMSVQIAELRAAGAQDIFLWAYPGSWSVATFKQSVADAERLCAQHQCAGYIADVETPMTAAQATSFGAMLRASADSGLSVGLTSYAGYQLLADFGDGCNGAVWGLCQIYNHSAGDAQSFAAWLGHFRGIFGRAIPCVVTATLTGTYSAEISTPAGYDDYLAKIPNSGGWASFGVGPDFMQARLASWRGVSLLDSCFWLLGIPTVAHVPVAVTVMLALIALGAFLLYRWRLQ